MKKLILASAVALIATSASAATIYKDESSSLGLQGRVEGRAQYDDDKVSDISRVRFGIAGRTAITDQADGVAYYETELNKDGYSETRYANIGIETKMFGSDFGAYYGKADGSLGQITDYTDILNTYGGWAGSKIEVADRTENNLLFVITGENAVIKANVSDETDTRDSGYAISGKYDFGNINVGAGYAAQDELKDGTSSDNAMLGAGFTHGGFYAGALYSFGQEHDVDYDAYELAASYTVQKVTIAATWTSKDSDANSEDDNHFDFDVNYAFNKHLNAYAGVSVQTTLAEDDVAMVGAKYAF